MNKQTFLTIICHLSIVFAPIIGPGIIYFIYKDDTASPVRLHALQALAFHLFVAALLFISLLLTVIFIGAIMLLFIPVWAILLAVKAALLATEGKIYRYPFTSQFVANK